MDWIVSLTPEAAKDPLSAIAAPPNGAAIVELRLDLFPGIDIQAAVAACPLPVLATLRSSSEGGKGPDDPGKRAAVLSSARDAGATLLDIEYDRDLALLTKLGLTPEQIVVSWHDPNKTPDITKKVAEKMLETPARWVKIVTMATKLADLEIVLSLHQKFNNRPKPQRRLLTFAMGIVGLPSRYLAPLLGPPIGYAAWNEDAPAAPGQLSIAQSEAVISHLNGPPQRLYGVVGADVSKSLSPVLHSAGYRKTNLPYLMLPISIPSPDDLVEVFAPSGFTLFDRVGIETRGWAVTAPYKTQAAAMADIAAPRVLKAGAANTLVLGPEQVLADNTDADGVVGSLTTLGIDPLGRIAVVQGSGGAARGAAIGLHLAGAEVFLRGRSTNTTREVAKELGIEWCAPDELPKEAELLVNATPLGGTPGESGPFTTEAISRATAVVDMVYSVHVTELAAEARKMEIPVADGREVLLHQGFAQFAAFTNRLPPKEEMRAALGLPVGPST